MVLPERPPRGYMVGAAGRAQVPLHDVIGWQTKAVWLLSGGMTMTHPCGILVL